MKKVFFVTGIIASGKSSFMQRARTLGFKCVDADKIAHSILASYPNEIAKILDNSSFLQDGIIDRKRLGRLVFNDDALRKKLEKFMHPKIKLGIVEEIQKSNGIIFVEMPLLFETKDYENLGEVIVIYAPKELCLSRLMQRNNLSEAEALQRLNAQMDIEEKRKLADIVIENLGSWDEFEDKCEEFFRSLN